MDPVVLAGWLFWLPIFGLGGVALALGWNRPYYLDLLADPSEALAAAQLWGLVGFLSLAAGASLPAVRRAGRGLGRLLPRPGGRPAGCACPAPSSCSAGSGSRPWPSPPIASATTPPPASRSRPWPPTSR
ncbi:MAG: hypothetical protein R2746_01005 [Acidimicrobiales bacterium]